MTSNKLLTIISLSIVGVLIFTVILLSIIPINLNLPITSGKSGINKPDGIQIHLGGKVRYVDNSTNETDTAIYNEIIRLYDQSASYTVMSALFAGALGNTYSVERLDSDSGKINGRKTFASLYQAINMCIVFIYDTEQDVYNANGSE
ncbi:MAG: hypothetical protein FWG51_01355, partial [Firmicutes bacterium]|nr:hypothetical protein [Bacillota bacterium]